MALLSNIIHVDVIMSYKHNKVSNIIFIYTRQLFNLFLEGLISYSIPKGVQRGLEVDLSDQTYDGKEEGDRLVGGLGQLVDGQKGTDNFRSDIHGFGKGMFIIVYYLYKTVCNFLSM